ncbi:MAG: hypothetical protein GF308_16250 [Candidatus Heimdallarchaeota archaeon]|nr:hypothetical protein [Candidatus Heimdallarchaeota archaeon]
MGVWCNPNIIRYNHDLDKAREYMAKAGFEITEVTASTQVSETGPGFGVWITIASMMAVSTVTVIFFKKRRK